MRLRQVSEADIDAVVARPASMADDPSEGSVVVKGSAVNGMVLVLWVVGSQPLFKPWVIKSVAWKPEEVS